LLQHDDETTTTTTSKATKATNFFFVKKEIASIKEIIGKNSTSKISLAVIVQQATKKEGKNQKVQSDGKRYYQKSIPNVVPCQPLYHDDDSSYCLDFVVIIND
jgi:hypothetical protein